MGGAIGSCCPCFTKTISGISGGNPSKTGPNFTQYFPDCQPSSICHPQDPHVSRIYGSEDEFYNIPSDDPKTYPLFTTMRQITKESLNDKENDLKVPSKSSTSPHNAHEHRSKSQSLHKLFSSCSTIYVDNSTVSQPNCRATIECLSIAIHSHLVHRTTTKTMDIFDEKKHPLTKDPVPDDYDQRLPELKTIHRFLRVLFTAAQLTPECAIVTLIYLERVLSYGQLNLCPANWKRLVLGAVMLASKVWDDQAVWNIDYCQILKDITVSDMNELEREYVQLLQFNVNVGSSVYAKYYFDLREIAKEKKISFPNELLTKEKAIKLEALSLVSNRLQDSLSSSINTLQIAPNTLLSSSQSKSRLSTLSLRRSASMQCTQSPRKSLLIIS